MPAKTYTARAKSHKSPLARRLFEIMDAKRSNLAISADVTDTKSLLELAEVLGPHIAVFKTHIDIVQDFSQETVHGLTALAKKHDFLIFEDRKFIDIGNTVKMQYCGALQIVKWAHFVNASILAGEGTVQGLEAVGMSEEYERMRGLIILAEMSTKDNLATGAYTRFSVEVAKRHPEFVIGFIANGALPEATQTDMDFLVFTTGINQADKGDVLGQKYQTPGEAVRKGSDIIIVGRGIYGMADPVEAAKRYQREGWEAYEKRVGLQ